jgi:hypothetical protein
MRCDSHCDSHPRSASRQRAGPSVSSWAVLGEQIPGVGRAQMDIIATIDR